MNDSGEIQEVESNHSGRLSHVPSQPEVIPSSSSVLSRDERLPFDTWNAPGLQENVFGNQSSTIGLPEFLLKKFFMVSHMKREERQNQFHEQHEQGPVSKEMTSKTRAQFQCCFLEQSRRP